MVPKRKASKDLLQQNVAKRSQPNNKDDQHTTSHSGNKHLSTVNNTCSVSNVGNVNSGSNTGNVSLNDLADIIIDKMTKR